MKILFVTNSFSRIHLYYLAKVLSGQHHEIAALSFEKKQDLRSKNKDKFYKYLEIVPAPEGNFLSKLIRSILSLAPLFVISNKSNDVAISLKKICKQSVYDVIIFEQLAMGQYYSCVDQNLTKIIFPVDSITRLKKQIYEDEHGRIKKTIYFIDYLLTKRYEKSIYKKFEAVIFVSPVDAEYAVNMKLLNRKKVHILPNGVDTEYYHPNSSYPMDEPSLVFVGNMADYKSEHAILWFYNNVWERLKQKAPGIRLYVVGRSPSEKIKALSSIDRNMIVTGYVDDLRPHVWYANLFVSPLQLGTGMKNRILEAMAMGKAIVASPLSVEGITGAEDQKNIVIAYNADEFVENILSLLKDKERAKSLGAQARLLIEELYSLDRLAEDFTKILSEAKFKNKIDHGKY